MQGGMRNQRPLIVFKEGVDFFGHGGTPFCMFLSLRETSGFITGAGWVEVDVALGWANVGVGDASGPRDLRRHTRSRSRHGFGSRHGLGELLGLGLGAESGPE
ncbi:unnamed protein product [Prunus brigantina]